MSIAVYHELLGKKFDQVEQIDCEEVHFYEDGNLAYKLYHQQDCCEGVSIASIDGSLDDLVGEPILMAEFAEEDGTSDYGSATWTFFKFATIKGYVTIRFYGESNGYYSETADLAKHNNDEDEGGFYWKEWKTIYPQVEGS